MCAYRGTGRVGGLTVALGVGAAIVTGGTAVAWASPADDAAAGAGPAGAPVDRSAIRAAARPAERSRGAARVPIARQQSLPAASTVPAALTAAAVVEPAAPRSAARVAAPAAASSSGAATGSASATAEPAVNPIAALFFNQTPTLSPVQTGQSSAGVVTGQLNASDPDSSPLRYTVVTAPAHGSVSIDSSGQYTYSPDPTMVRAGYTDSFTVSASDEGTGFHIHGLMGLINLLTFGLLGEAGHTSVRTVTVRVTGTSNLAPTATVSVGSPDPSSGIVTGTVNASDYEGDALTYSAYGSFKGSVVITNLGDFTYTPNADARHAASSLTASPADQSDSFFVAVSDRLGSTALSVTVPIVPANNVPTGSPSVGAPDATTGLVAGAILGADADSDPLVYTASSTPNGTINIGPDGRFTYTPTALARHGAFLTQNTTTDTFTVTITDGYGGSVAVPVTVTIAPAGVSFTFTYGSGANYWTTTARDSLSSTAASLGSYFVVAQPVTLSINVSGVNQRNSGTLAYASTDFTNSGAGFTQTVIQTEIQTGVDVNGGNYDGYITYNWYYPWALGNTVSGSQYDFKAVALHELLHTVGFLTGTGSNPATADANWTSYDSFLADAAGNAVIDGNYEIGIGYLDNFTGADGGLYFSGSNAVAAYGGLVPLYTPSTWAAGSSVSHVDQLSGYVMNPASGYGLGPRVLTATEIGILRDLGYTMTNSPGLPAFVVIWIGMRRRRRR